MERKEMEQEDRYEKELNHQAQRHGEMATKEQRHEGKQRNRAIHCTSLQCILHAPFFILNFL